MPESDKRIQAFKLVDQALRLQLTEDGGGLPEVEKCLNEALELHPEGIEILQEAAHFYDAVQADPQKARKFAAACRNKAEQVVAEMRTILGEGSKKTTPSAARHIGGIIGPY